MHSVDYLILDTTNVTLSSRRFFFSFLSSEVALKVHLSDASTHQPLSGVTVEIFTNHTPVASDISGADGNAFIRFPYRLGDLLVVTATKRGYVPNSIPWRPSRLPGNDLISDNDLLI